MIGEDDLVGVMTPEMSAGGITFARRTTTVEGMLSRYWYWGERDRLNSKDPEEDQYRACYPGRGPTPICPDDDRGVADEMIERRKEKQTIDALEDLVGYLRGVREERKAILAISDGWRLLGPNPALARRLNCTIPTGPDVRIDPRGGKLTTKGVPSAGNTTNPDICDRDRMTLAHIDDGQQFRRILDEANRANASFYPIDPRGLVVFDTSLADHTTGRPVPGSTTITPPSVDNAMLTSRLNSLRTLAEATDGLAIVDSNNLDAGLKRVVSDLSSYYLLGYYSTGKLDGKFHSISVRVKRPGVQVRARRGFLAATPAELTTTGRGAPSPTSPAASATAEHARALEMVLAPLSGYGRDLPLRLLAAAGWKVDGTPAVWVVAEAGRGEDWMGGGEASAMLVDGSGTTVATSRVAIDPGARGVRLTLAPSAEVPPGEYDVRLRVKGAGSAIATTDATRIALAAAPNATGAVFLRRGPTTGNKDVPTADLRFRRSDQLKVETPALSADQVFARLLDRTGKPLSAIPVTAATRIDPDGSRWQTAQLSLVPLGAGDYVIELTTAPDDGSGRPGQAGTEQRRTLVAFRVVP